MLNSSAGRSEAHLTLLLREPLLDRLEIEVSTQRVLSRGAGRPGPENLPEPSKNYDYKRQVVFYPLCNRLLPFGVKTKDALLCPVVDYLI